MKEDALPDRQKARTAGPAVDRPGTRPFRVLPKDAPDGTDGGHKHRKRSPFGPALRDDERAQEIRSAG